jgi:hypothetical protein
VLFNLHRALESRSRTVILVEGFFDTLAVHQSGYPAVVSLMGSALSRWQTDLLSTHFDQVLLMLSALIILLPLVGCVLRQDGGVRADTQQLSDGHNPRHPGPLQLRFTPGHDASLALQNAWDLPTLAGSGAFRSTARDMVRFVAAYSRFHGTALERVAPLALEPRRSAGNPSVRVGLAWHVVERNGARFAGVDGQTGGYAAFAGFAMSTGTSVVVLSNSARSVDDIGWHVLDPSMPVQTSFAPAAREIVLDPSELHRFVGQYGTAPADLITITRERDSLWRMSPGSSTSYSLKDTRRFS